MPYTTFASPQFSHNMRLPIYIKLILIISLTTIVVIYTISSHLFTGSSTLFYQKINNDSPISRWKNHDESDYSKMTEDYNKLLYKYQELKIAHEKLSDDLSQCRRTVTPKNNIFERKIPEHRNITRPVSFDETRSEFENRVTVLIYGNDRSVECITRQVQDVRRVLANVSLFVATNLKIEENNIRLVKGTTTEGNALNSMVSSVTTEYVLYLSRGSTIEQYTSNHSVAWLYQALRMVPEVDVVGGSFLVPNSTLQYAQLNIECHRLKMCYWTLRQRYEYQYSVCNMMVCEETSSSFLARTNVFTKLKFDPTLDDMVTTDFFWRAKRTGIIVGLMPEVYFHIHKSCQQRVLGEQFNEGDNSKRELDSLRKQRFMDKYSLKRIVDSFGHVTDYPTNPMPVWVSRDPQAIHIPTPTPVPRGTPPMSRIHQLGLVNTPNKPSKQWYSVMVMDEFFKTYNITYTLEAGLILGGLKMRDIIPWDRAADVDMNFFGIKWQTVLKYLNEFREKRGLKLNVGDRSYYGAPSYVHLIALANGSVINDIKSREYLQKPTPDELMYVFVHDRYVPALRSEMTSWYNKVLFPYSTNYLRMQSLLKDMKCQVPGHHACVPDAFQYGGGHWSDFYCQL